MYLSPTLFFLKCPLLVQWHRSSSMFSTARVRFQKGVVSTRRGYIGRNHAHPRNHGAVSDETKIPRLPKAIVGSESIRTLPSLPWRPEVRATLEIAKYDPGVPSR